MEYLVQKHTIGGDAVVAAVIPDAFDCPAQCLGWRVWQGAAPIRMAGMGPARRRNHHLVLARSSTSHLVNFACCAVDFFHNKLGIGVHSRSFSKVSRAPSVGMGLAPFRHIGHAKLLPAALKAEVPA